MNKKRATIIVVCVCLIVAAAGAAWFYKDRTGGTSWTSSQDGSLDVLTMQVAGGNVVAMTGDGWAARDGYVQLQLSGSSIPGQTIESVTQDGGDLTVTLKSEGDEASLDLLLTEYRLEGGDVSSVERVLVDYGTGEAIEVQEAYE